MFEIYTFFYWCFHLYNSFCYCRCYDNICLLKLILIRCETNDNEGVIETFVIYSTIFELPFVLQAYLFLGNVGLSYGMAFIVSLAFESPMMGLEKVLLGRGKNS